MKKESMLDEIILKVKVDGNGLITCKDYIVGQMANIFDFEWLKEYDEKNKVAPATVSLSELEKVKAELVDALIENAKLKDELNRPRESQVSAGEFNEAVQKIQELLVERDELQGGIIEMAKLLGRRV